LNNDTIIDLAVGALAYSAEGTNRGAAYVLFLNTAGGVKSFVRISSSSFTGSLRDNDNFGGCVSMTVDLNGDGVIDLAVGASGDDDGGIDAGAAYIFFLQTSGLYKSFAKISGATGTVMAGGIGLSAGQLFGNDISVTSGSDMDGDGVPDLGVGCWAAEAIYIVFIRRDGTAFSYTKIMTGMSGFTFSTAGTHFGSSIELGADLNGDSHPDAVVGARVRRGGTGAGLEGVPATVRRLLFLFIICFAVISLFAADVQGHGATFVLPRCLLLRCDLDVAVLFLSRVSIRTALCLLVLFFLCVTDHIPLLWDVRCSLCAPSLLSHA
jgi:hypothetical protein